MRRFSLARLEKWSQHRPAGYREDVLANAKIDGDHFTLEDAAYDALIQKWRPATEPHSLCAVTAPGVPWGPPAWEKLHRAAVSGEMTPEWMALFSKGLPMGSCGCRRHWEAALALTPPPYSGTPAEKFRWTYDRHEEVNARKKKPSFSFEQAQALYLPAG